MSATHFSDPMTLATSLNYDGGQHRRPARRDERCRIGRDYAHYRRRTAPRHASHTLTVDGVATVNGGQFRLGAAPPRPSR